MLSPEDVERTRPAFDGAKAILTQFEADLEATEAAMRLAAEVGATVILNPAPYREVHAGFFNTADILMPNEVECSYMTGIDLVDDASARAAAERLSDLAGTVIVTLGDRGVFCPEVGDEIISALAVDAIDTTGAGDTFAGIFAAYLARGLALTEGLEYALASMALSTTQFGISPSMPDRTEIETASSSIHARNG